MKKIFLALAVTAFFVACNDSATTDTTTMDSTATMSSDTNMMSAPMMADTTMMSGDSSNMMSTDTMMKK